MKGRESFTRRRLLQFSNAYLHLVADDTRWIGGNGTIGPGQTGTRAHIEFPTVQRTGDLAVLKAAGAEWAAAMRALVVDAIELSIHVPYRELPTADMHSAAVSRRNAHGVRDRNKFAHLPPGGLFVWSLSAGAELTVLFFFQGMSRAGMGGGLGLANCNSGSVSCPGAGGAMFSRQPATRACKP